MVACLVPQLAEITQGTLDIELCQSVCNVKLRHAEIVRGAGSTEASLRELHWVDVWNAQR